MERPRLELPEKSEAAPVQSGASLLPYALTLFGHFASLPISTFVPAKGVEFDSRDYRLEKRFGEKKSSLRSNRESGLGVPILGSQEAGKGKSILGLGGPFIAGEPPSPLCGSPEKGNAGTQQSSNPKGGVSCDQREEAEEEQQMGEKCERLDSSVNFSAAFSNRFPRFPPPPRC